MALRLIYRSYGGENHKGRPSFYSKQVCLSSFLRAAQRVDAHLVFLNDGPIPEERDSVMRGAGSVVELPGVGMRRSYLSGLRYAASSNWDDDDVIWFSEDDYLYTPDALTRLVEAADALRDADYFALYGSTPAHPAKRDDENWARRPKGWHAQVPRTVGDQGWVRIYSTASTFGVRLGALREDVGIFRFCMAPHRTMYRDHDTGLLLQGFEPYGYGDLCRAAIGLSAGPVRARVRQAALAPFLLATNLRSHRRAGRRRALVAADPNLCTHMEVGLMSPGRDWAAVAAETHAWREGAGPLTATVPDR